MSFGTVHPDSVKQAVAAAALRGDKIPAIVRALSSGRLKGHTEPYELPLETARYYAKQAKNKAAASTVSKLAAGDPSRAIDHLARQALTEAEIGLREVRAAKTRDPDAVARWVNVLKGIAPLLRPETAEEAKGSKKRDKRPSDPLTERLTSPPPITLTEVTREALRETTTDETSKPAHWPTPDPEPTPRGGVLAQPPFIASS